MQVTLDKTGWVVLPKSLRTEMSLEAGDTLELESDGERVTLSPVRSVSPLRKEQGVWVFHSGRKVAADATDQMLERLRGSRDVLNRGRFT